MRPMHFPLTMQAIARFTAGAALATAAHTAAPDRAQASCVAPKPSVIWSFPAQGATDVPIDADLIMVTQGILEGVRVRLDGEQVAAASMVPGHYDLGELEASSKHEIVIDGVDSLDGNKAFALKLTFTTGSARAAGSGPERVAIVSASGRAVEPDGAAVCTSALYANTCFDTGTPLLESFETGAMAVAWAVERVKTTSWMTVYPGECGQPRALDYPPSPGEAIKYRVHAIHPDGTIVSSAALAGPLPADDPKKPANPVAGNGAPAVPPADDMKKPAAGTGGAGIPMTAGASGASAGGAGASAGSGAMGGGAGAGGGAPPATGNAGAAGDRSGMSFDDAQAKSSDCAVSHVGRRPDRTSALWLLLALAASCLSWRVRSKG